MLVQPSATRSSPRRGGGWSFYPLKLSQKSAFLESGVMVCTPVCARVFFLATFVAKSRLRKFEFRRGRQRPDTAAPKRGLWSWLQLRKFLPQAGGRPVGRFWKTSLARICWCYFLCLCLVVCGFLLCFSLCFFCVYVWQFVFFLCFLRCYFL